MEGLKKITSPNGEQVIRWAKVREENSFYPDIIFELDPHFSVGRSLFCPTIEISPRHLIISGGHKKEGVFFAHNCRGLSASVSSLSDVAQGIISFVLSQ